jgi:putative endonuclease
MLLCADSTLYAGVTTDLQRRLCQHNGELGGRSSIHTSPAPGAFGVVEKVFKSIRSAAGRSLIAPP